MSGDDWYGVEMPEAAADAAIMMMAGGGGGSISDCDDAIRALVAQSVQIECKFQEMDRQQQQRRGVGVGGGRGGRPPPPSNPQRPHAGGYAPTGILSRDVCRSIIRTYAAHVDSVMGNGGLGGGVGRMR